MTTSRIPYCNDGAGRNSHALACHTSRALSFVHGPAGDALNFAGLPGLGNLPVSQ